MREWNLQAKNRLTRLERASGVVQGKLIDPAQVSALLEAVIEPGDRVCLEDNNQKQADFLARCLIKVDPSRVHDLHLVQSVVALLEHVELFERGIARRLDFSFSGPQSGRMAQLVSARRIKIGAIHTYVDFVVRSPTPHYIEPLFTRDPAQISEVQVLMAMLAIKGVYAEYQVNRLNHGIGFDTAAIELLLPTYADSLGLKGRICQHWALNPHPTLIPAIESGFVKTVHSFGSELGMENDIAARPDVFFTGPDGSMRSNRILCQAAGHYACDMFIGSTLQIDLQGNSSTATLGRITGFGGAPNMGADARGRRHISAAWLKAGQEARGDRSSMPRGFGRIWEAVLEDFFNRHEVADVAVSINDAGATPAVVSLRLDQALEEFQGAAP